MKFGFLLFLVCFSSLVFSEEISTKRLLEDVKYLTTTNQARNYLNKEGTQQTVDYIKKVFSESGGVIELQRYYTRTGFSFDNVIVSFGPMDKERIIIAAHYDVCELFPGADDNASGVAGILELSRLLKTYQGKLTKRIDLVAYGTEEPPHFGTDDMGSFHHAKMLADKKVKVDLMLALDGIGFFTSKPKSQLLPFPLKYFYSDVGDYIAIVGHWGQGELTKKVQKLMTAGSRGMKVERLNGPSILPGLDWSDHRNFWKFDYPGLMISDTAFYRNENYHTEKDTYEKLNYAEMSKVVSGLFSIVTKF